MKRAVAKHTPEERSAIGAKIRFTKSCWTSNHRADVGAAISKAKLALSIEEKNRSSEKRKHTIANWDEKRKIVFHQKLSKIASKRCLGSRNPFFGRHHTEETKEKLREIDRSYTKTLEFSTLVKNSMVGIDTSCDLKAIWRARGGDLEVERCENERREKISARMRGAKNPMFGKPRPHGGNGWKGHYHGWFFRSLHELSYVVNVLEPQGLDWSTAEKKEFEIPWVDWRGTLRTYRADFLVSETRLIECKPRKLHVSPQVVAKQRAAELWCQQRGWQYELVAPPKLTLQQLEALCDNGDVILTDATQKKLEKFRCHQS